MKLTAKSVAEIHLPRGKAELIVFDTMLPGFGLRIRRGGRRTFVFQFKLAHQQRRVTIGNADAMPLSMARDAAVRLHAAVRLGRDPAAEIAERREGTAETMRATLPSYLAAARARLRPRSYAECERALRQHCRPLHGKRLADIDRRAVAALIASLAMSSGTTSANRVRAMLSKFFSWAMGEGLVDSNPVIGTNRQAERSRDRVLTNEELKAIWAATSDPSDYSAIVRLLLLCGARATELGSLRWDEVHGDRIELGPERTKSGKAHVIYLAPIARQILEARPRRGDFVFGRVRGRPFTGWSTGKAELDKRLGDKVAPWRQHDFRRVLSTRMHEKDLAPPHIIEAQLGHAVAGIAGIYNRAGYAEQRRAASEAWARYVADVVG